MCKNFKIERHCEKIHRICNLCKSFILRPPPQKKLMTPAYTILGFIRCRIYEYYSRSNVRRFDSSGPGLYKNTEVYFVYIDEETLRTDELLFKFS